MDILILTAIAFIIAGLETVDLYLQLTSFGSFFYYLTHDIWIAYTVFVDICWLTIGVLLLLRKNKKIMTIVLSALTAVVCIYSLYSIIQSFSFYTLFLPITVILLLLLHLNIIPQKTFWFLPGTVYLIYRTLTTFISLSNYGSITFTYVFVLALILALFGYGYCLKENLLTATSNASVVKASPTPAQTVHANAEELKQFYSLYKDGVITEEEYNAKRDELLGK